MRKILRDLFPAFQRGARRFGVHIDYFGRSPHRDSDCYAPLYQPWRSAEWQTRLRADDPQSLVSLDRKYLLYQFMSDAVARCDGDVAECGVYRGGTAYILAARLQEVHRPLHLFDTFGGMPKTNPDRDVHVAGDFQDTDLGAVQAYLRDFGNVRFHPGLVPDSLAAVSGERFAFVSIDLDIHDAILSASTFFYSRMPPGAVILYDDYGFPSCPGARAAVDTFFVGKPETPIVLQTGQCLVVKH